MACPCVDEWLLTIPDLKQAHWSEFRTGSIRTTYHLACAGNFTLNIRLWHHISEMSATISHMNPAVKFNQVQYKHNQGSCSYLEGVQESRDLWSGALPTTYYYCLRSEDVQWLQNGDLHKACHGSVPLWNILILLEYTGLSWLVELYFLMLVSVRLLMNVWKFGRTLGQTFLSLPSDTGEEQLLMSGCPTYFADTGIDCYYYGPSQGPFHF